ncbi:DUF6443 domain-containing protein [Flavivirga amylovorans]|uniref:DUF6443 domain-containing protein n=1 Tax=Flavivirga amylovorans TaxID=870486 RepID=A0ABT8X0E0_9FLAO|nr:DUF6443 domain-containing protein [Flavivirga amylovorans]MDO5987408.1 DUF6443 domain-containing protein [Flavivirga amylovorans]
MYLQFLNKGIRGYIFFIILLTSSLAIGQDLGQDTYISGPTEVNEGETWRYTLTDPLNQIDFNGEIWWGQSSGSIQGDVSDVSYVDIKWDNYNPNVFYFVYVEYYDTFGNWLFSEIDVDVTPVNIAAPTLSSVTQPSCSSYRGHFSITNYNSSYFYSASPSTDVSISGSDIWAPEGNYTITATSGGFNSPPSTTITINAQPEIPLTPTINFINQPTIDVATASLELTDLPVGSWTINPGNISGSGSSTTITGLIANTTYNFTVTNNTSGCTSNPSNDVIIHAQPTCGPSNENYIHVINPREATTDLSTLTDDQKIESITYYDGLGRPMQSIGMRSGGGQQDIVTHIDYDGFGRQDKDYLPYVPNTNACGQYQQDALVDTEGFYNTVKYENTLNPYSQKQFEASPLNRVLKQAAPGEDWKLGNGHEIEFEYQSNTTGEVRQFDVALTAVTTNGGTFYDPVLTLNTSTEFYSEGELYKTITKDENHDGSTSKLHTTEEFKDKQGMVVLKRTYANVNEQPHDTYYIYDDYGNLTYVLPPQMNATTNPLTVIDQQLNGLGYQYTYDYRNRLIKKRIPGKDPEEIVYDKLDRPIFTQDGNLKVQDKWLFTKYDVFGRVVYTGIYSSPKNRKQLQKDANDSFTVHETKEEQLNATLGDVYYTNNVITTDATNVEVLTVNYYDNYDFDIGGGVHPGYVFSVSPTDKIKGLATGSKVKVLDDDPNTNDWITTVSYYDEKARPIHIYSHNEYLATTDKTENKYDFTGQVIFSETEHAKNGTTVKTKDNFIYDHMGRLTKQSQIINNVAGEEVIVKNTYDELGQLLSKGVGGKKTAPKRLQNIDYTYNIRGWLKQINDTDWLGKDLFAFKINYNTVTYSGGHLKLDTEPLYNGNISETIWKTANDNKKRGYGYRYDALNRITDATYKAGKWLGEENQFFSLKDVVYDKNGNIQELIRNAPNATFTDNVKLDKLFYKYKDDSNQLSRVSDMASAINTYGFKDYNVSGVADYNYDKNGNMRWDKNKGITNIIYNHLNLPTSVSINGNGNLGTISYIYDASGTKLEKVVTEGSSVTKTKYAGNYVYKDSGAGDLLKFFNHAEGYVDVNGSNYSYVYQYKDHLGNVRLSYKDSNNNGVAETSEILEENNYYPFGLKHKGYNNVPLTNHKYERYNGQEFEEALGLNVNEMTFRQYDPAIGRFMVIDPAAEMAQNWTPYRFGFNNPILFSDPTGLWEIKDGNWYTDDAKDIERFVSMLGFEEMNNGEEASIAQIDTFISEEFRGSGGRLSNGSILLDTEVIVGDSNGNSNGFSARQVDNIRNQHENYGSNPWNEKSSSYNSLFYSYKYFRERSWYENGGSFPGVKLGFFAGRYAQKLLYNPGNWWFSTKVNKFYDWSVTGNGSTGGRDKYIGKLSQKYGKYVGSAGKLFGVYGLYNTAGEYANGTLTGLGASYIGGVDAAGIGSKNINVAAWSLGTGIGKSIVESSWYFNAIHNDSRW